MKLSLLFSSLLLAAVGCAGEQASVDDDATSDESELRAREAELHVTYGFEYAQKGVTVTFELNPSSPDRERCAPEVRVVPREERTFMMDSNQRKYTAKDPTRGGCLYWLKKISFEVECIPHPRRQCLEGTSTMHVLFADDDGVDYDEWRMGEVMGTDGSSQRNVLVLPTDVRERTTAFSSLFDVGKIYYFGLRSGY